MHPILKVISTIFGVPYIGYAVCVLLIPALVFPLIRRFYK